MTTKVSRYLTDMKELPPVTEETTLPAVEEPKKKDMDTKPVEKEVKDQIEFNANIESKKSVSNGSLDYEDNYINKIKVFTGRDLGLAVVNFISILVLIFFLIQFPGKSRELKKERNQMLLNDAGYNFELSEVGQAKAKANEINKAFVDESGIVSFVNELEKVKARSGTIQKIAFTSQKAIEDKQTGNYGIPVVIEFKGGMDKILEDLEEIQKLPYILRPITVQSGINDEDPNVLDFKYGGFIYVNDLLGQSR